MATKGPALLSQGQIRRCLSLHMSFQFFFSLPHRLLNSHSCDSSHTPCHLRPLHVQPLKTSEGDPGRGSFQAGWNQLVFLSPNVPHLSAGTGVPAWLVFILCQALQEEDGHLAHAAPCRPDVRGHIAGKAPREFSSVCSRVRSTAVHECQSAQLWQGACLLPGLHLTDNRASWQGSWA